MKVALSASYFEIPCVAEVLLECEAIFTTNVMKRDELYEALGEHRVKFLPSGVGEMYDWVKSRYPSGTEFITFPDLRKIIKAKLTDRDVDTAERLLDYCGWGRRSVYGDILYTKRGEEERYVSKDGEIPDEVFAAMAASF